MNTDTHISTLEAYAWAIENRKLDYKHPGWTVTVRCGLFASNFYCIMDDYGYLVEVPAPWSR